MLSARARDEPKQLHLRGNVVDHSGVPASPPDRLFWADAARSIACIQVIGVHAFAPISGMSGDLATRLVLQLLIVSFMTCVPIFAMLTGALILAREKAPDVVAYSLVKVCKIIALTVFWELVFVLTMRALGVSSAGDLGAVIKGVAIGAPSNSTLWYMYQLVGLYLIIPYVFLMLQRSTNRANILFIALGLALSCLPVLANKLFGLKYWLPFPHALFSLWPAFMVAGYVIVTNSSVIERHKRAAVILYLGALAVTVLLNVAFIPSGLLFHQYEDPLVVVMAVSCFALLMTTAGIGDRSRALSRAVGIVAPASFGVYLVHYPILRVVMHYLPPAGIVTALLQVAVTFAASCMIAALMLRLSLIKRLITV